MLKCVNQRIPQITFEVTSFLTFSSDLSLTKCINESSKIWDRLRLNLLYHDGVTRLYALVYSRPRNTEL